MTSAGPFLSSTRGLYYNDSTEERYCFLRTRNQTSALTMSLNMYFFYLTGRDRDQDRNRESMLVSLSLPQMPKATGFWQDQSYKIKSKSPCEWQEHIGVIIYYFPNCLWERNWSKETGPLFKYKYCYGIQTS